MTCGSLEIDIMNSVWHLQEMNDDNNISVKDVAENLTMRGTNRAYTTIKTVMDRLVQKDMLVRYRNGKKFYYNSVSTKNEMAKEAVELVVKRFFDGSYTNMSQFVEIECRELINA